MEAIAEVELAVKDGTALLSAETPRFGIESRELLVEDVTTGAVPVRDLEG